MADQGSSPFSSRSLRYVSQLSIRSGSTFLHLTKIMLPVMLLVRIGEEFGLSEKLGLLLGPVMKLVGLPAEAGIVWAVTIITGIYGGIGAYITLLPVLDMNAAQISILTSMMLFAHALPVEQAIVREAGASYLITGGLRIVAALVYGGLVAFFCQQTGWLSEPHELTWIAESAADPSWTGWAITTLQSLLSMLVIIFLCFLLIDTLEWLGVMNWITRGLTPMLNRIGVPATLVPLTTIGLVLGLAYGGGLILEAARKHHFTAQDLFLPFATLSLLHALIEDTLLMLAIGGDIWVILVFRMIFSFAVIVLLAKLIHLLPKLRRT